MDNRIQLNETVLRGKFTLPSDAAIINVMDLDQSTRDKISAEADDDVAITRASVRATSRVVNAGFGELVEAFREPTTIPKAVAHYCRDNPSEAGQVFEDALPILLDLVKGSILVSEHNENQDAIEFCYEVGDTILEYRVIQKIQLFSDSEVYQVKNSAAETFAIKIARPNCPSKITQQLKSEAETISCAQSNDSLSVVEQSELDGCYLFVMPWIQGAGVDKVAAEYRQSQDWKSLLSLFASIVEQYHLLHSKEVLHGDIHPGNILVDAENKAHLIDFGHGIRLSDNTTQPSYRGGVAFYFEPEYARAILRKEVPPKVTKLSEQFSLSALLYFLATGNYYDNFELEQSALYQSIANAQPQTFLQQGAIAWDDLENCLNKGLALKPQERFSNLSDMLMALNTCQLPNSNKVERPSRNDAVNFVEQSKEIISVDQQLFNTDFEFGPSCSVNGGAGGIAYALLKLANCHESPDLLAQAELWFQRARDEQGTEMAFMNTNFKAEYDMVGCVSTHHAAPGISFIGLLLSMAKNDLMRFQSELGQFIDEVTTPCDNNDTTLGKLSTVLAIHELREQLVGSETEQADQLLLTTGSQLLEQVWQDLKSDKAIGAGHPWKNLGFAHGWAGLLYTTILWTQQSNTELPDAFYTRVFELTDQLFPQSRGLALNWLDENGGSMGSMSGWCNGSTGVAHLYCALYQYDQHPKWLKIAQGLAWNVWESQDSPVDLCCGVAGRIFALLKLAEVDDNAYHWTIKAKQLSQIAVSHGDKSHDEEHPPHSLFKGQLGVALAVEAVRSDKPIHMPMMGLS